MPFTPVDIRPGRVRERTGRKTDGIPVRHYPYLMPVRRGRKGYSTVAVKKQCVVGRLNAVPCNRREYHVSIPVYTLRLQRPGNFQSPGGRSIHLPHYHITTEIALAGRYVYGPIAPRNGCRDGYHPFDCARFHSLVGPYQDAIGSSVRRYRMQIVALAEFELRSAICKVGHERSRVGGYTVTMQIQIVTYPAAGGVYLSVFGDAVQYGVGTGNISFQRKIIGCDIVKRGICTGYGTFQCKVIRGDIVQDSIPARYTPFQGKIIGGDIIQCSPRPGNVALQRKVIGSNVVQDGVNT